MRDALQSIEKGKFTDTGKRIIKENSFSENDLNVKFARLRKDYPIYDEICRTIQAPGDKILEETLLHAAGMEAMLRILITIAEEPVKD